MKKSIYTYVSWGCLIVGAILASWALLKYSIDSNSLAAAMGNLSLDKTILIPALGFCIVSFLISMAESKKKAPPQDPDSPEKKD